MALARRFPISCRPFASRRSNWPTQHTADAMLFLMERPTDWVRLRECDRASTRCSWPATAKKRSPAPRRTISRSSWSTCRPRARCTSGSRKRFLESVAERACAAGRDDRRRLQRLRADRDRHDQHHPPRRAPGPAHDARPAAAQDADPARNTQDRGRPGRRHRPRRPRRQAGRHAARGRRSSQSARALPADGLRSGARLQPDRAQPGRRRKSAKASRRSPRSTARSSSRATAPSSPPASTSPRRDADLALPKGFGARHWAAADISRATSAIAITVSQSSGTVRLFQNGEVMPPHRALPPPHEVDRIRPGTGQRGMIVDRRLSSSQSFNQQSSIYRGPIDFEQPRANLLQPPSAIAASCRRVR